MAKKRKGPMSGDAQQHRPAAENSSSAAADTTIEQPAHKRLRREQFKPSSDATKLPQKRFFRQRAHANPISDHDLVYPRSPAHMDWAPHFPAFVDASQPPRELNGGVTIPRMTAPVQAVDVGCGFGGLLFAIAPKLPTQLILGLEIRVAVTEYVERKIRAVRAQQLALEQGKPVASPPPEQKPVLPPDTDADAAAAEAMPTPNQLVAGRYQNISVLRANAMKFLPNFFAKGSIQKLFFCFPDPHFKARKHKQRIVSGTLVAEYAYVLAPGGLVLTITDVEDLAGWMARFFDASDLFERVSEDDVRAMGEGMVEAMRMETEEGRKVTRNAGPKFTGFWRRLENPPWPDEK